MYQITAKVYGAPGHRQRMSFSDSVNWDFTDKLEGTRLLEISNFDKTGTHDFTLIKVVRDTKEGAEDELSGQITDGYFENACVGKVEIVSEGAIE